MYRRPSKKQQLIRRSLVLIVMIISVLVIVAGVTLFVLGYRLDSINGRLQQGALVQFNSQPTGGRISIDGTVSCMTRRMPCQDGQDSDELHT